MANNFKKFDVKHGLSVNGLEFVDENRNVTLNNLTVQGTSTVIDTRTLTTVDPVISLGKSGQTYTITAVTSANPGRLAFSAEDLSDFALSDSVKLIVGGGGAAPGGLTANTVYYVKAIDTDVNSSSYGTITVSATQGGSAIEITSAGSGTLQLTLNPLQDLGQDLGIEVNYVDSTAKTAFFGFDDSTKKFTYIQDASYAGSAGTSDDSSPTPAFSGTKGAADFSSITLQPSSALSSSSAGIQLTQTWNAGSNTFDAIEIGITDTASASASRLIQAQIGGVDKFVVRKDGVLSLNTSNQTGVLTLVQDSATQATTLNLIDGTATWNAGGSTFIGLDLSFTQTAYAAGSLLASISASANRNLVINAEGEVISRSEFTSGGVQTALLVDVTDTSSGAASLLLDLQKDNVSQFAVTKAGGVTANSLTVEGTGSFRDEVTIEAPDPGNSNTYADTTNLASEIVVIAGGSTAATVLDSVTAGTYTTYEYLVQAKQASNGHIHSTKILLVQNGTDVFMTEYGTVYSNDILLTFDADHNGGNFRLLATKTSAAASANNDVTIKLTRISITA
jgi:hypothetical protein